MREHGVVFKRSGIYAGWPANHGAWQWRDEFLVGFLTGKYGSKSMHYCHEPFTKHLARSIDGGMTWEHEQAPVDFNGHNPTQFLGAPDSAIFRVCGVYDHGGDDCPESGSFYWSSDRGKSWNGPFLFAGLEEKFAAPLHNTSRSCALDDLLFLSNAESARWGTDQVFCARRIDNKFVVVGDIGHVDGRVVMPSATRINNRIVVAARRRSYGRRNGWVDSFVSDDEGKTWEYGGCVGDTGGYNGNPPAIAVVNGKLLCVFANRDEKRICFSTSVDGITWSCRESVRDDGKNDIGYPRLFVRNDDRAVCVYYWADAANPQQHIAYTVIDRA